MYEPLEAYLQEVKAQLKSLPRQSRDEEISEIRLHLYALINESMKCGVSEADAVKFAIAQFGDSQEVGRDLKRAWAGSPEDPARAVWAGTAIVAYYLGCYATLGWLLYGEYWLMYVIRFYPLVSYSLVSMDMSPTSFVNDLVRSPIIALAKYPLVIWICGTPFVSGWIAGKIAPQRATLSVATIFLTPIVVWALSQNLLNQKLLAIAAILPFWLMTYVGAKISKRWKRKHAVRAIQQ